MYIKRFNSGRFCCIHLPQKCRRFASVSGESNCGGMVSARVTAVFGKADHEFSLFQSKGKTGRPIPEVDSSAMWPRIQALRKIHVRDIDPKILNQEFQWDVQKLALSFFIFHFRFLSVVAVVLDVVADENQSVEHRLILPASFCKSRLLLSVNASWDLKVWSITQFAPTLNNSFMPKNLLVKPNRFIQIAN